MIWDWGGVMTNPIRDMVAVWLDDEDVDHAHYAAMMRPWVAGAYDQNGDTNPIHALERGECTTEEFERLLAARIARRDGVQVMAEGLLARMFAGSTMAVPMQEAVQAIRAGRPAHRAAVQLLGHGRLPAAPVPRHVRRRGDLR